MIDRYFNLIYINAVIYSREFGGNSRKIGCSIGDLIPVLPGNERRVLFLPVSAKLAQQCPLGSLGLQERALGYDHHTRFASR